MAILTKEEARAILEKVIKFSTADECEANLTGKRGGNIRYARNSVSTSGMEDNIMLTVQCSFGKKQGTANINEFDDTSLEKVVRRAEELARLAPENPEFISVLPPQQYLDSNSYFKSTADISPDFRADAAAASINPCKSKDMTAAGFLEDAAMFQALMNSKGLFAYNQSTRVDFTVTIRSSDGKGSGYAVRDANDVSKINFAEASEIALKKAMDSRNVQAIEPGKYTVILEPAASVDLLQNMIFSMAARAADEGRSFLAAKGGTTRLGEKLFDERVNIYSDPTHPEIPVSTWAPDGSPREKTTWIENGVVKNMMYSRFWAEKKGVKHIATPGGFIMDGGKASLKEMIKDTKKGILVTRLWYIRQVDPRTLLYTGLTRDGTFYIEDGKIKYPIKNFRFNESPIIMLNNLEALGKPERINGNLVPPMKISNFTFSSISDAV